MFTYTSVFSYFCNICSGFFFAKQDSNINHIKQRLYNWTVLGENLEYEGKKQGFFRWIDELAERKCPNISAVRRLGARQTRFRTSASEPREAFWSRLGNISSNAIKPGMQRLREKRAGGGKRSSELRFRMNCQARRKWRAILATVFMKELPRGGSNSLANARFEPNWSRV